MSLRGPQTYAAAMWFLILLVVVVVAYVAYRFRVPLLAKVLGQPRSRIERRLNRPRD